MSRVPHLSIKGLSKGFKSGRKTIQVLEDLDLDLYPGEMTLLMGPSGSGKSTLLAGISGLQRPDAGEVLFKGENIWKGNRKDVAKFRLKHCGFIFQSVHLLSCMTARQQVIFLLEQAGIGSREAGKRADEALDSVGLTERAHLMTAEMSGGEQQRVAIARTLAMKPALIFADEPTSALDSINGHRVVELLHDAAKNQGAMVLAVTHDERIVDVAERVIHIEDGQLESTSGYKKDVRQSL